MNKATALIIALAVAGCEVDREPESMDRTSKTPMDYRAVLLFEHEGCRTYRFTDHARYVYYVRCRDGMRVEWDEKKHSRIEEQGTETVR